MKNYFTFFIVVLLVTFFSILIPTYGQWQKYIIDDDISTAYKVSVADFDGDAKPDLVVSAWGDKKLVMYQNDFPAWNKRIIDNVGTIFGGIGDINSNGTPDVVACLYNERKIVWYQNNYPFWNKRIIDANTDNADFTVVADIDGDDTMDVVTAGSYSNGGDVVWYENNQPNWIKHTIESGSGSYPSLNVTDIDGDGLLDLAATMNVENKVVWFRNENKGLTWTKYTVDDSLDKAWWVDSGDINGDGSIDLVVSTHKEASSQELVWYENNHPTWPKHVIEQECGGGFITDVDGDDTLDVIGYSANTIVWFENNHPTWTINIIETNLNGPKVLAIADVDDDKIKDLIVPAESEVVLYKNPYATVDTTTVDTTTVDTTTVGVEEEIVIVPTEYSLNQNYPNPFNPTTTIKYSIPSYSVIPNSVQDLRSQIPDQARNDNVTLKVYDILGREVVTLVNEQQKPGYYVVKWNATELTSGIYFYRIQAGEFVDTKKMILLK